MTTGTNNDKRTEPRLLSEAEIDAVTGGMVQGSTVLALAVLNRICLDQMLPPEPGQPCRP
jgi:hypothetical protein